MVNISKLVIGFVFAIILPTTFAATAIEYGLIASLISVAIISDGNEMGDKLENLTVEDVVLDGSSTYALRNGEVVPANEVIAAVTGKTVSHATKAKIDANGAEKSFYAIKLQKGAPKVYGKLAPGTISGK